MKMRRSATFLAVPMLLCIVPSETASEVLRCRGERQSDGQIYFNMTYDLMKGVHDCETQWIINGTVTGIASADGNTECVLPLLNATANIAILKTCPEKLECLLICPSANINKKEPCSCDITSTTRPVVMTSPARPEVGVTDLSIPVCIVCVIGILLILIVIMLYKKKRSGCGLCRPHAAEEVV